VYHYDVHYGNLGCKAHDEGLEPFCDDRFAPAWCYDAWCYVDPDNCDKVAVRSKYFPDAEIYYSYGACGSTNSYSKWYEEGGAENTPIGDMIDLIEGYVRTNRIAAEASPVGDDCRYDSSCPCRDCSPMSQYWKGSQVNFDDITVLPGDDPKRVDDGTCIAQSVATTYLNVASKEYDDLTRVGYQYFGHHSSGGYGQWPMTDLISSDSGMCDGYDPRFRPWYTSGATGPKDVVLVLDKSGSMGSMDRISLAREAALVIIDTFSDYDFVGVVLFDNSVEAYNHQLVPGTAANKKRLAAYIESNYQQGGSTNFIDSIRMAFTILQNSVDNKATSTCNRAIMFLTDGKADFGEADYSFVQEESKKNSVAMLTYSIGEGAEEEVTKRLACENRGVFYKVADGGDLGSVMSRYYLYFALGSRSCTVRWVEYDDWITNEPLLAGCLPFYSGVESSEEGALRGVSCVDVNMVAPLSAIKSHPSYDQLQCMTRVVSMQCEALYLRDCDLQRMREEVGRTCPGDKPCTASDGYCVDPTCKDDITYKDSQGYYCDQWVGDDCTQAYPEWKDWGYTQADEDEILRKCPYSCKQCTRLTSPDGCDEMTCGNVTGNVGCRDRIAGVDDGENASPYDHALAAAFAAALLLPVW
jgi:hypothetical protein